MGADLIIRLVLVAAVAAALAGGVAYIRHSGVVAEREKWQAVNKEEREARKEMISGLAVDLANERAKRVEDRLTKERELGVLRDQLRGRVNEFVPPTPDAATCLRAGWVRYVDAAAAGMPLGPRPGPGVAEAPSGVTPAEAAGAVAENYLAYHGCTQRVTSILKNFDSIRSTTNSVVDRINERVKRAERKVQ